VENYRPGKKYFPAGIESKPGMKEALYYSDRKVATISYKDDRNITLKMHGYFATLCRSQERSWSEKTSEHYIEAYYAKDGNTPFYYIAYKDDNNEAAMDLCPLDSANSIYGDDENSEHHQHGTF
jgi:hypothetical protein